ncbi:MULTISPECIES: alpha-amylase family glycosyl hydrolase [unclassified Polaribacter]|uniref:alpha-amylase family glycosyl hydrolase n=1 Tax=unclassified Polaribacter TaxID=196858 RepID=UPI0011BFD64A|nr:MULTISPECIES: alpha-amylase family glycosyl hydrolase [unclassified Polaribacter]TXD51923.1 alpha-amlyase [Polaribacter sp. IC063]TXD59733.1 alpha-amlyase [Polaribacter sp. IC066]
MKKIIILFTFFTFLNCKENTSAQIASKKTTQKEFVWEAANIYFLLTDRFNNGDKSNDINFERTEKTGVLRGFKGGDIKGITQKIKEGYFTDLGINAIWMTPVVEQIHGVTDEGTGFSYGYHGYWTKDWTKIDPNFGTKEDLKELVDAAHKNGIRVLLDAVINHTGPVTEKDTVWPTDWVRTTPTCSHKDYKSTVTCTLVENLPDIRTESNEAVKLPPQLVAKWKAEGRYEQELKELDDFFAKTGHPRAPRFYIMKWLTDYITEFGIDGYRVDTVKHTEEYVWQEFKTLCEATFAEYKKNNPEKVLDNNDFYLVGEVYNYAISQGKYFDLDDKQVNYFHKAFNSLINFEIKWNAKQMAANAVFVKYDSLLNTELKNYGVLNYMTSHDDGNPFDKNREIPYETATMLLLTPGTSQVYYGDESARDLTIDGAVGDATLRSFMNWDEISNHKNTKQILNHWQKLGQFRANHPSVGAGKHQFISEDNGLVFSRVRNKDQVVVGIHLSKGKKVINVATIFKNGEEFHDFYSNTRGVVKDGKAIIDSDFDIVLLEKKQ